MIGKTMHWNDCARELGRALSRYDGYTNYPNLGLIEKVLKSDEFSRPFRYAHEVIREFEEKHEEMRGKKIGARSAEVYMQHLVTLGFLRRATEGATMSHPGLANRREAGTHLTLSQIGRAMRSSVRLDDEEGKRFRLFLWEFALLENDFDMYGLLLKAAEENGGGFVDCEKFIELFYDARERQIAWMKKTIPTTPNREQIQRRLPWIGQRVGMGKTGKKRVFALDKIFMLEGETPSHHFKQRRNWAMRDLGHVGEGGKLTESGRRLTELLPSVQTAEPFFWLAPPKEYSRSRFLASAAIPPRQFAPAWNLLCPHSEVEPDDEFIHLTAAYMEGAFDILRLGGFKQASLDAVVPYVYFLGSRLGRNADKKDLFRAVLRAHRDKFVCTLRENLWQSHYWLRKG